MESFECVCGQIQNNHKFKKHFKVCVPFRNEFKDLDCKIITLSNKYNPLLMKYFLLRYVKMFESKCKNNNKNEFITNLGEEETKTPYNNNMNQNYIYKNKKEKSNIIILNNIKTRITFD
jgi:hypothetical protein